MSESLVAKYGKQASPGEILFAAGDVGDAIYVVRSGFVRIFVESNGIEKTLAVLGPGEIIGEMAMINNRPRSATAEVVEDAELLVMEPKVFEEMIIQNSEIAVRVIRKLGMRLEVANSLVQVLLFRDPEGRVIENLKRLARIHGWMPGQQVEIAANLEEMADQVGLPVSEVQNVISRLIREGALAENAGEWIIKDLDRLSDLQEFLKEKKKFR